MTFMNTVNVLLYLLLVPSALAWGAAPPEIYINGIRYASIQDYKAAQSRAHQIKGFASPDDEEFLRAKSKERGIHFDPKQVKTITLTPAPISPETAAKLERAGYEHGVSHVMTDFSQNWDNPVPKFTITSEEVEGRLRALVGDRREPVMIVSGNRKLRVIALQPNSPVED
jgi:hypothetical protein